jgi:hypothetical protein
LTAADYLTVANIAFIKPIHPGENPVHGNAATSAQTKTNRAFAVDILQYTTSHTVKNQLKTMLLEAVPNTFIQLFRDQCFEYSQLTTLELLTHLDTTYGEVTNEDLANNLDQMNMPWDLATPIKDLWTHITRQSTMQRQTTPSWIQQPCCQQRKISPTPDSSRRPLNNGGEREKQSKHTQHSRSTSGKPMSIGKKQNPIQSRTQRQGATKRTINKQQQRE